MKLIALGIVQAVIELERSDAVEQKTLPKSHGGAAQECRAEARSGEQRRAVPEIPAEKCHGDTFFKQNSSINPNSYKGKNGKVGQHP